jgi:hypothetical protein
MITIFRSAVRLAATAVVSLTTALAAPAAWSATIVDLGFLLDGSGSVSAADYTRARNGLADAMALIPVTGDVTYRVGVVSFGSNAVTNLAPTVLTADTLDFVQTTIRTGPRASGTTAIASGIDRLVADFADIGPLGAISLINITTDGVPNVRRDISRQRGANALEDTLLAAQDARAAGWDGISVEAVGSGVSSNSAISFLLSLASPGDAVALLASDVIAGNASLTNPTTTGFVLRVNDFDAYPDAILAKVQRVVDDTTPTPPDVAPIPLPAAGWLLLAGLGALTMVRRRAA